MAIALLDGVIDELTAICGPEHVFTGRSALFNRTRVPAPFPAHKWEDHIPSAVVLPTSAEQVSEVVKLANRHGIPVVPRAGATGLTDGAVPLRHGILVDIKLMNQILEIDHGEPHRDRRPGDQHAQAQRGVAQARLHLPGRPGVLPVLAGRGTDRHQRLVADRRPIRPHPRSRDLVRDRAAERRGRSASATAAAPKVRKSSSGYQLKHLFMGHQGTLGIVTEATLELVPRPEAEFSMFLAFEDYLDAWRAIGELARSGVATLAGVVLFDEWKLDVPAPRRRGVHPAARSVKAWSRAPRTAMPTRSGSAQSACCASARHQAATTSATRSPRATGRRATIATPRRSMDGRAMGRLR